MSPPSAARARAAYGADRAALLIRVDANTLGILLDRPLLHSRAHVRISLDVAELTDAERDAWRTRLERAYNACGCGVAATFLLASLPILAAVFAVGPFGLTLLTPVGVLVLLGFPIAATVGGKIAGLVYLRRSLREAIAQLSALLAARRR